MRAIVLAFTLVVASGTAAAQTGAGLASSPGVGDPSVDHFTGEFTQNIPIQVPPNHGLEPHVSLQYHSGGGNGFAGVGWSLEGVSVIQRAGPGKGVPLRNANDVFYLDGAQLVACGSPSVSPGCNAGGTHSTQIETYSRIAYDPMADTWTVTQPNGTVLVYASIFKIPGAGYFGRPYVTYRWGLVTARNTHGITVAYNWWCDQPSGAVSPNDCYPDSINSNGTVVKFYREGRTDSITLADGFSLVQTSYRLKTVDVTVLGARARAYELSYGATEVTGKSILTRVQQHGNDAALDATYRVVGGTVLPATTFSYQPEASGQVASHWWGTFTAGTNIGQPPGFMVGDVNGDNKADLVQITSGTKVYTLFSNGDGTYRAVSSPVGPDLGLVQCDSTGWNCTPVGLFALADVDGNGTADIIHITPGNGVYTWLSMGDGTWAVHNYVSSTDTNLTGSGKWQIADINGDGKTDLIHLTGNAGDVRTWLANGDGTYQVVQFTTLLDQNLADGMGFTTGDINGDGKADLIHVSNSVVWTWISSGDGTYGLVIFSSSTDPCLSPSQCAATWRSGDFNGDGKTDLAHINTSNKNVTIWVSNGNGNYAVKAPFAPSSDSNSYAGWIAADLNGDGITDLYHDALFNTGTPSTWFSLGDGTFRLAGGGSYQSTPGDFDGDGKTDMVSGTANPLGLAWFVDTELASGSTGTLLSTINNGLGATTTLGYTPSSAWLNQGLPFVVPTLSSITVTTAEGSSSTSSYQYAGGLWDVVNRRFLGFHYAKQILPCIPSDGPWCPPQGGQAIAGTSPIIETWFAQDYGSFSKPTEIRRSSGAGTLLTDTVYQYGLSGNPITLILFGRTFTFYVPPYISVETGHWTYAYDGQGACPQWSNAACSQPGTAGCACAHGKRTYVANTYDNYNPAANPTAVQGYGNQVQTIEYGDYDVSGDERTTTYAFAPPNTAAYLVAFPAVSDLYAGIGSGGAKLHESVVCYDQPGVAAPNCSAVPTLGDVTQAMRWLDSSNSYVTSQFQYDAGGNLRTMADENGATTTIAYDATFGVFPVSTTNPLNQVSTISYDFNITGGACAGSCLVATRVTDFNNVSGTIAYDALARPIEVDTPLGGYRKQSFCQVSTAACGALANQCGCPGRQYLEVDNPSPDGSGDLWARNYFDGLGRVWRRARKGPSAAQPMIAEDRLFTARGTLARQSQPYYRVDALNSDPMYWAVHGYDSFDRQVSLTHADGTTVSTQYGMSPCNSPAAGATCPSVTTTDELGHAVTDLGDVYGRHVAHVDARGTTTFSYNLRDTLTGIGDPSGHVLWSYVDDSLSRITQTNDPDLGTWTYRYYANGDLYQRTDAKGQTTQFTYDGLRRKRTMTARANSNADTTTWTYDEPSAGFYNLGHLTTETNAAGSKKLYYDAAGRVQTVARTIGAGATALSFSYSYDAGSRLLAMQYPDGDTLGGGAAPLAYDGAGRLKAIPGVVTSAGYDAAGRLIQEANANGTNTNRSFWPTRDWLWAIGTSAGTSSNNLQNLVYSHDNAGHITSRTSPFCLEGWSYAYDTVGRLTSAMSQSDYSKSVGYSYDNSDNITNNSNVGPYSYWTGRPHAVNSAGGQNYLYDANGSLYNGGGRSITYDGLNRAVTINGTTVTYAADGTRLTKTSAAAGTTTYLGDDYESSTTGVTKYIRLGGRVVAKRVGGATYWLHDDHLGSTNLVTDASGAEVWRQKYGPYGAELATSSSLAESTGYLGERQDETGLLYLHARYYDPQIGQFISADTASPLSPGVGLNRYAYGGGNPISFADHDGHDLWDWVPGDSLPPAVTNPLGAIADYGGDAGKFYSYALGGGGGGDWASPGVGWPDDTAAAPAAEANLTNAPGGYGEMGDVVASAAAATAPPPAPVVAAPPDPDPTLVAPPDEPAAAPPAKPAPGDEMPDLTPEQQAALSVTITAERPHAFKLPYYVSLVNGGLGWFLKSKGGDIGKDVANWFSIAKLGIDIALCEGLDCVGQKLFKFGLLRAAGVVAKAVGISGGGVGFALTLSYDAGNAFGGWLQDRVIDPLVWGDWSKVPVAEPVDPAVFERNMNSPNGIGRW